MLTVTVCIHVLIVVVRFPYDVMCMWLHAWFEPLNLPHSVFLYR